MDPWTKLTAEQLLRGGWVRANGGRRRKGSQDGREELKREGEERNKGRKDGGKGWMEGGGREGPKPGVGPSVSLC